MLKICLLLMGLAGVFCVRAQNTIGLPEIINFQKQAYGGGTQNWDIRQDRNGILYFANNDGLLSYDGTYWKTYPLPNKTNIRSLEIGPDHKIYIGAQGDIGYFSPDKTGALSYSSIKHLIPEKERAFADVWDVINYKNQLFFRASSKIIQVAGSECYVYPSNDWRFMGLCHNYLIAQEQQRGLLYFNNGVWTPLLANNPMPPGFLVTSISPLDKDRMLITTFKHGVFIWSAGQVSKLESPDLQTIATRHIYASAPINNQYIMLATSLEGCYVIDHKGKLIQGFSREEGLQNNNVRNLFVDRDRNIWLGLDNGIDFVAYNNSIKHIYPDHQSDGSGYASIVYRNDLYLGTSDGLYRVPFSGGGDLSFLKASFQPVANTKGQVWNLSVVNDQLLLGHHEGCYKVQGDQVVLLDKSTGYWTFLPSENVLPAKRMVTGTYQGLSFFNAEGGNFSQADTVLFESARFVTVDGSTVWVAHPYKGIYKIVNEGSKSFKTLYTDKNGLKTVNNNYVFRIRNRVVFATEKGVFEYNPAKDLFEPSPFYTRFFGDRPVRYLKEDGSGNIWFIADKKPGVIDFSFKEPQIIYLPELNNKMVNGFENIYPFDKQNVFMGSEKGFYHINYDQYKKNRYNIQVLLRKVQIHGRSDSLMFAGYFGEVNEPGQQGLGAIPQIDYGWNSLHLEFASPLFGQGANVEYSYRLKGFDRSWSAWSRRTEKDYTNLPSGSYTFEVKARNNLGNESAVNAYSFVIQAPWYQTYWAYTFYIFVLFALVYFVYRRLQLRLRKQEARHEEEQKRLQYLHQLELEKSDKEIVKLRNEKLESEIQHKNTELASSAMHLVQKGELLARIKEELMRLKKSTESEKTADDFKRIIRILNEEDKMDADWEQFAHHFDKVHSDFLVDLKKRYPALSANELKLSAYLRMNLTTKEIAQLMNISIRGVEISRYRLRKKLHIPTSVNLFDFLIKIGGPEVPFEAIPVKKIKPLPETLKDLKENDHLFQ